MASGRGSFPLNSAWLRSKTGFSRANLLRTTPLQDPVVETIWTDFFFRSGIQFVGSVSGIVLDNSITLSLTALRGGIDTTAREGDFVVVAHFNRNNTAGDQPVGVSTSGFAEVADLFGDDDVNANLSVSWKRMGSTPDTTITTEVPNGRNIAIAYVLRGVDPTTPLDVTATTATAINTGIADPPSITPVTAGAWVIAIGGSVSGATTNLIGPNNYAYKVDVVNSGGSSPWGHLGIAALRWSGSGAVDPEAWTGVTDGLTYATCSVTLAIRPDQTLPNPTGSASITLGALTSAATGTVEVRGSSAVTLDALTSSAAGTVRVAGSGATTLDALTASAAGTVRVAGSLGVTLGDLTLVATGTVSAAGGIVGTLAVTLGDLTGSGAGTVRVAGSLAVTLGGLSSTGAGTVRVAGSLALTLGSVSSAGAGTVRVSGSLAATLGDLTLSAAGTVSSGLNGSLAVTLGILVSAAAGTVRVAGTASVTLGAVTALATGTVRVSGTLAATLGPVLLTGEVRKPGGKITVYLDGEWRPKPVLYWTGTQWREAQLYHWNGSNWRVATGD